MKIIAKNSELKFQSATVFKKQATFNRGEKGIWYPEPLDNVSVSIGQTLYVTITALDGNQIGNAGGRNLIFWPCTTSGSMAQKRVDLPSNYESSVWSFAYEAEEEINKLGVYPYDEAVWNRDFKIVVSSGVPF